MNRLVNLILSFCVAATIATLCVAQDKGIASSTAPNVLRDAPKSDVESNSNSSDNRSSRTPTKTATKPSASVPFKVGSVTISGNLRTRFESWNWFDTTAADGSYNFGALTLRLALSQSREKYDWLVEGVAPVLFNLPDHAIAPSVQGQLGQGASYFASNGKRNGSAILKQGFIRFKSILGNAPSSLKLGRFEFSDGLEMTPADPTLGTLKRDRIAQRLIGSFGFTHIGRSFDGVLYAHQKKTSNVTLLAARPTSGVFDLSGNKELDVDFQYGAFTKQLKFKSGDAEYRVFALQYRDSREALKTDNRNLLLRQADKQNIRLTTLGAHYIGVYKAGDGKFDVLAWGAGQFGTWGTLDQRAGAIAFEGGYQPGGTRFKPWIRAGYFHSTGDQDPNDLTHQTFFQGLPTPRIYARYPFFNLMNNQDVFAELMLKPHPKLAFRADVHQLRLSSAKDLWYLGGGAFQKGSFGYVGRPSNGNRALGTLIDLSADYTLNPRSTVTFYVAHVLGGGVISKIYPAGPTSTYAYLEFTYKF